MRNHAQTIDSNLIIQYAIASQETPLERVYSKAIAALYNLNIALTLLSALSFGIPFEGSQQQDVGNEAIGQSEILSIVYSRVRGATDQEKYVIAKLIHIESTRHHIDPALVLALIHKESSFRIHARSKVGAIGLMQIMPTTGKYMAKKLGIKYKNKKTLFEPSVNIKIGIAYLAQLRRRFQNDAHFIAAYNWGPTAIRREINTNTFSIEDKRSYVLGILKSVPKMHKEARRLKIASKSDISNFFM